MTFSRSRSEVCMPLLAVSCSWNMPTSSKSGSTVSHSSSPHISMIPDQGKVGMDGGEFQIASTGVIFDAHLLAMCDFVRARPNA